MVMAVEMARFMAQWNVLADDKVFMVKGRGGRNSQQVVWGQARCVVSRRQAEGVLVVVAIDSELTSVGVVAIV